MQYSFPSSRSNFNFMKKKLSIFFLLISIEVFVLQVFLLLLEPDLSHRFSSSRFLLLSSVQKKKIDINFLVFFRLISFIALRYLTFDTEFHASCFVFRGKIKKKNSITVHAVRVKVSGLLTF